MAGEIKATDVSGKNLYCVLLNVSGQAWNGATFAAILNANWATYPIALTEQGTTGIYLANFPAVGAGRYSTLVYERAGGSAAVGDVLIAQGSLDWSGTVIVGLSGTLTANAVQWNGAAIATAVPNTANLDVAVSTRSTFAGGAVASVTGSVGSVTAGVTVTTNNDKSAYLLASSEHTLIAADVLDVAASGHNVAASIGQKINSAGTAGDPLTATVPGAYGANTAGAALGAIAAVQTAANTAATNATSAQTAANTANTTAGAINTKLGVPAVSVSADIAALPNAAAIANAVWNAVMDGAITSKDGMVLLIASILQNGTNTYNSGTRVNTTVLKRQDGTTTAATINTTLAAGSAAPAPTSVTSTPGTLP